MRIRKLKIVYKEFEERTFILRKMRNYYIGSSGSHRPIGRADC